jgi:hypothetical protein
MERHVPAGDGDAIVVRAGEAQSNKQIWRRLVVSGGSRRSRD